MVRKFSRQEKPMCECPPVDAEPDKRNCVLVSNRVQECTPACTELDKRNRARVFNHTRSFTYVCAVPDKRTLWVRASQFVA